MKELKISGEEIRIRKNDEDLISESLLKKLAAKQA